MGLLPFFSTDVSNFMYVRFASPMRFILYIYVFSLVSTLPMTTSSSLCPPLIYVYCNEGIFIMVYRQSGIIPRGLKTWSPGLSLDTPPKWSEELLPLYHPGPRLGSSAIVCKKKEENEWSIIKMLRI